MRPAARWVAIALVALLVAWRFGSWDPQPLCDGDQGSMGADSDWDRRWTWAWADVAAREAGLPAVWEPSTGGGAA